jgi:uncharacterized protein (TIGR02594 family)
MPVPKSYNYLLEPEMPRMIQEAVKLYGILETPGSRNNPTIMAWAKEVGGSVKSEYIADSVPWCGLFMAVVAKRADYEPPKDPLWALNWTTFGKWVKKGPKPNSPAIGDVLVFTRSGGGHVGLYVGQDSTYYYILGGNQSDRVNISKRRKNTLYTARRPNWRVSQPTTVKIKEI